MTVYGDLLRLSIDAERSDGGDEQPTAELALRAIERRAVLATCRSGIDGLGERGRVAVDDALSLELSYDVVLVRLCERLGLSHDLLGRDAGPRARRRAEESLAERLPMLAALLEEE
jgi:hypothetical protein